MLLQKSYNYSTRELFANFSAGVRVRLVLWLNKLTVRSVQFDQNYKLGSSSFGSLTTCKIQGSVRESSVRFEFYSHL